MRQRALFTLIGGALLAACDTAPTSAPDLVYSPSVSLSAANGYADVETSYDAVLAAVSARHPGFKGLVGTPDGKGVEVLATGPAALARAGLMGDLARALGRDMRTLALAQRAPQGRNGQATRTLDDRPDFHVLYRVKTGLRRLLASGSVRSLDADEVAGRVVIGVASEADEAAVRAQLSAEEARMADIVRVEPISRAVAFGPAAADDGTTLTPPGRSLRYSVFAPMLAGPELDWLHPTGVVAHCTQGPIVQYANASWGFLTNAHCTRDQYSTGTTQFYQPTYNVSADLIGVEAVKQRFRDHWFLSHNDGYYADVVFARSAPGRALIGQMTSATCDPYDCVESGPITDVAGSTSYVPVNVPVFKTGRTTGTTMGRITNVCVDEFSGGFQYLCQNRVVYDPALSSSSLIVGDGDSGSSVMTYTGAPGGIASVTGILWARYGQSEFVYSPWENIVQQRAGSHGLNVAVLHRSVGAVMNPLVPPNPDPDPDPDPDDPPCGPTVAC